MRKVLLYGALILTFLFLPILEFPHKIDTVSADQASVRTVFVHLFEWKWDDVAQECENFLGPKGFSAVQVSPPQEHVVVPSKGFPWWQRYQPVSYKIQSRSGDRQQFASMISRCHAVGVKVYADAVINHMSGEQHGSGSAGSTFTKYSYPGLYKPRDFHTCHRGIQNYDSHDEVTNCELVGLPDLNTGSPYVRKRLAQYLADLSQLGVDGFRIDAAKHIHTHDLGAILAILNRSVEPDPYIYQEVIDPGNEAVKKREYYPNGDVHEFEYGRQVGAKFFGIDGQNISQLQTLGESWGLMPSDKAIVFIDNHDKQRGHGGGGTYITYKNSKLYELANIFMLAFPYGYPQVMSSYEFSNSDQGPPSDEDGNTHSVYVNGEANCFGEWKCEHRWGAIANMIGFHNYTSSELQVTNWWSDRRNQIAFGRGNKGFIVINRESEPLTRTFQTSLSPGTYCNIVRNEVAADGQSCTANQFIVVEQWGRAKISVAGMDAIAIYGGAKLP